MKTGICTTIACAVVLALAMTVLPIAQAQMGDVVKVNLPYAVTVGEKTLSPGDYEIRQLRDLGGGSRVLLVYSDRGMKFELMAMTIPTLDLKTPEDTKVILSHIGNDYYFDKIWVQGKNYGYEFVLPKTIRERQSETTSIAANSQQSTTTTTDTTVATNQNTETQAVATEPVKTEVETPVEAAPAPAPTPVPEVAEAPVPTPAPVPDSSADRMADQSPADTSSRNRERMPATSAGWLTMLFASGGLFSAGLALRRKA